MAKLLSRLVFCSLIAVGSCWAIGEERFVEGEFHSGDFVLARAGGAAGVYVDASDYAGVTRAAKDLSQDIQRVTGAAPAVVHEEGALGGTALIIGTLGKSALIDRLIHEHKIDAAGLQGKWESYLIQTVAQPIPGVSAALVIAGSDKRERFTASMNCPSRSGSRPGIGGRTCRFRTEHCLLSRAGIVQGSRRSNIGAFSSMMKRRR